MLHFTTPAGTEYTVNEKGQIGYAHPAGGAHKAGAGWTFLGITAAYSSGRIVLTFEQLTPEVVKATQWKYTTSRNPRFTVVDLDHGTRRTWGNTKDHGIGSMWFED